MAVSSSPGGEQQMLAIGRALLFNPRLLVMDEPTEGLAPVIVEQVAATLKSLGRRCAVRPAGRAKSRRGDRRGGHDRRDGQWPHRPRHAGGGPRGRQGPAAASAGRDDRRRAEDGEEGGRWRSSTRVDRNAYLHGAAGGR
jgi:hypothetical protein